MHIAAGLCCVLCAHARRYPITVYTFLGKTRKYEKSELGSTKPCQVLILALINWCPHHLTINVES